MKAQSNRTAPRIIASLCLILLIATVGCGTTASSSAKLHLPTKYITTDGRTIEIGESFLSEDGWKFHPENHFIQFWMATNIDFTSYDTLYIEPTKASVTPVPKEDELLFLAKKNLAVELAYFLKGNHVFENIVTGDNPKTGERVLRMENTIIAYEGGTSRWNRKILLRIKGNLTAENRIVLTYEIERRGIPTETLILGGPIGSKEIQLEHLRKIARAVTDFIGAVSGKYLPQE